MSLPDIYPNEIGEEAYNDFAPLVEKYGDPANTLRVYLDGLAYMIKQVDDMTKDGPEGEPGWSQMFDLTRAKTEWLPWIGQLVGYAVPQPRPDTQTLEEYDAQQRERIVTRSTYRRGTVPMLIDVIKEQLNEPKRVNIFERYDGNAYLIKVWVTVEDIATSQAEIRFAALQQKVAGLIMEIEFVTGDNYLLLEASNIDFAEVAADHPDYQSVLEDPEL